METYNNIWKKSDDIEVLKLVVEKGVDVNMIVDTKCNHTKLLRACDYNQIDIVKYLLTLPNIDIKVVSILKNTVLHLCDKKEIAKMLVEAGADINALNNNGETPIMSDTYNNNIEKIKYLASNGADLTIKNNKGRTIYDFVSDKSILKTPLESAKEAALRLSNNKDRSELIQYILSLYQTSNVDVLLE